jgi:hypothetical protein
MKEGRTVAELAQELMRQSETKRDFVADTRHAKMEDSGRILSLVGEDSIQEDFGIKPTAHRQFAEKLKIPKPYYDRMLLEAPDLLEQNVNHWLHHQPKQRMFRTLDQDVRAVLSPSYRALDNLDLAEVILPAIAETGLDVLSCEVTDERMYFQARNERITGDVKVGDTVQAGIVIGNSEIGLGTLFVDHMIYRLDCLNGMVTGSALRKTHVGRSHTNGAELDNVQELLSDSTRKLDDAAFFAKVKDVVHHVVSRDAFEETLEKLRGAAERQIEGDPAKAVEIVQRRLNLSDAERGGVLRHLIEGHDLSGWGLANAVTRLANDAESYDRAIELERAGAQIIELKRNDWQEIATAA